MTFTLPIATLAVGIGIATLSVILNKKTHDKINAVAKELRNEMHYGFSELRTEVSNLAQRVTAPEVVRTGEASIPPLPVKPSPKKAAKKAETKTKASPEPTRKIPKHRSAS